MKNKLVAASLVTLGLFAGQALAAAKDLPATTTQEQVAGTVQVAQAADVSAVLNDNRIAG